MEEERRGVKCSLQDMGLGNEEKQEGSEGSERVRKKARSDSAPKQIFFSEFFFRLTFSLCNRNMRNYCKKWGSPQRL